MMPHAPQPTPVEVLFAWAVWIFVVALCVGVAMEYLS